MTKPYYLTPKYVTTILESAILDSMGPFEVAGTDHSPIKMKALVEKKVIDIIYDLVKQHETS